MRAWQPEQAQSKGKESTRGYRKPTVQSTCDSDEESSLLTTMAVYERPTTGLASVRPKQDRTEDSESDSDCESVATNAAVYLGPSIRDLRQSRVDSTKNRAASSSRQSRQVRVDSETYRKAARKRAYKDGKIGQAKDTKAREVNSEKKPEDRTDKKLFTEKHQSSEGKKNPRDLKARGDTKPLGSNPRVDRRVEEPAQTAKNRFTERHQTVNDKKSAKTPAAQKASSSNQRRTVESASAKKRPTVEDTKTSKDSAVKPRSTNQSQTAKREPEKKDSLSAKFFKWFTKDFDKALARNW